MKRAVIIAKGEVQRVGYRDLVQRIARRFGVVGFVENVKPYDVKIVAEGEEEILKKFVEEVKVKKSPIFVEEVEVKFEKATREFEYFEIKRGDWKEELGERFDVAGNILYDIRDDQKEMLEKQDQTTQEIRNLGEGVTQKFNVVDAKYGKIAENMEKILEELKEERKEFRMSI